MGEVTQKQLAQRLRPHRVNGRWFYLGDGQGIQTCSFHHNHEAGRENVYGIPVSALLRALDKCGYLDQWDRKQQILRKARP